MRMPTLLEHFLFFLYISFERSQVRVYAGPANAWKTLYVSPAVNGTILESHERIGRDRRGMNHISYDMLRKQWATNIHCLYGRMATGNLHFQFLKAWRKMYLFLLSSITFFADVTGVFSQEPFPASSFYYAPCSPLHTREKVLIPNQYLCENLIIFHH